MKKYRVRANPKQGTVSQTVEAENASEAITKAYGSPHRWESPRNTDKFDDWVFTAKELS